MTILDIAVAASPPLPDAIELKDDNVAIATLRAAFMGQKSAFLKDPYPDLETRRAHLESLIAMMIGYRERIVAAMHADFGQHPTPATDLIEVLGMAGRARHAIDNLATWMLPETRHGESNLFGDALVEIRRQPKGVVGNISPWNFPFDLSVGPLIDILAAGNRAILKPSDYTPACSDLLAEMIAATFDPSLVTVAVGGVELAKAFSSLRWDHLLYTGSPNVGREIMIAAAQNLVPVTLELGGKCPAILTEGSLSESAVEAILATKLLKNGQMCISVDYVLAPRADISRFVGMAKDWFDRTLPEYSRGPDCTGIISERHMGRIEAMVQEARDGGYEVVEVEVGGLADRATRRMPLVLIINPGPELRMMQEEIFGPILPVLAYDDLDTALDGINAGERPLGIYVFGEPHIADHVLSRTVSGGAVVNACAIQGAIPDLPFGGIGNSGIGRHHGLDGFREFSNPRGVVVRGTHDEILTFCPPYAKAAAMVEQALGQ
jgi:coniferyl-aldehyde dehydrogenase